MMPEHPEIDEARLLLAAVAMHALVSRDETMPAASVAMQATAQADLLLAELAKPKS